MIDNRRSESRLDKSATVFIEICSAGPDDNEPANIMICNSLDLSANGLQVEMDEDIAVGSILRLCTEVSEEDTELYLVGEVKWTRPSEHGYKIGFELYDAENTDIIGWKKVIANMLN